MPVSRKTPAYHYMITVVIVAVAIVVYLFLRKNKVVSTINVHSHTDNLVKVICVRCENDPEEKKYCEKCGQTGYIWVDPEKVNISDLTIAP